MMQIKVTHNITDNAIAPFVQIWEESVRHSPDSLTERDLYLLKPFIAASLTEIENLLYVLDTAQQIVAFMGIIGDKIEMLFVSPHMFHNGLGKALIQYACRHFHIRFVDVTRQNKPAIGFYEHLGFKTFAKSELDSEGNPFPILHMALPGFPSAYVPS